jgi:hypothetical protein
VIQCLVFCLAFGGITVRVEIRCEIVVVLIIIDSFGGLALVEQIRKGGVCKMEREREKNGFLRVNIL